MLGTHAYATKRVKFVRSMVLNGICELCNNKKGKVCKSNGVKWCLWTVPFNKNGKVCKIHGVKWYLWTVPFNKKGEVYKTHGVKWCLWTAPFNKKGEVCLLFKTHVKLVHFLRHFQCEQIPPDLPLVKPVCVVRMIKERMYCSESIPFLSLMLYALFLD